MNRVDRDYNYDITYHLEKANQVADALIRHMVDVSGTILCAITVERETDGLEALEKAYLLCRIHQAKDRVMA